MTPFTIGFKKFISFMKSYGWILLLVIALIVVLIMTAGRGKTVAQLWELITAEREIHQKRVAELDAIKQHEDELQQAAARRAIEAIQLAQQQFEAKNKTLDKKTEAQIKKLVSEYKDDTAGLARKLSEQFGIVYIDRSDV